MENIETCDRLSSELIWLLEKSEEAIDTRYCVNDILYNIARDLTHVLEYDKYPIQLCDDKIERFEKRIKKYKNKLK